MKTLLMLLPAFLLLSCYYDGRPDFRRDDSRERRDRTSESRNRRSPRVRVKRTNNNPGNNNRSENGWDDRPDRLPYLPPFLSHRNLPDEPQTLAYVTR